MNLLIILLVLALFMGATLEYGHGYVPYGILLFLLAVLLLSRQEMHGSQEIKPKYYAIGGLLIIILDLAYNYRGMGKSGLATLDTMFLFLGVSFVARSMDNQKSRNLGTFGMYMSMTFIALYVTFFHIFSQFIYSFDHYFVMLPSAYLVNLIGIPTEVVAREVLRLSENLTLKIGGPCSGLYSMFMLISIITGYTMAEGVTELKRVFPVLIAAAGIAYIANIFRVSIIYFIGYNYSYDVMMTAHVHLGWMLFAITSLIILFALNRISDIGGTQQ